MSPAEHGDPIAHPLQPRPGSLRRVRNPTPSSAIEKRERAVVLVELDT